MNCKQAYRFICDNLDENITSARCREIRKHIACCPHCQAYLDSVKQTIRLYRTVSGPKLPHSIHRELMKALNDEMSQPSRVTGKPPRRAGR